MREDTPRQDQEKQKQVIYYITTKHKEHLSYHELGIWLYFIDFNFYEVYEKQLMGLQYRKTDIPFIFVNIPNYPVIEIPDGDFLGDSEKKIIDDVINKFKSLEWYDLSAHLEEDIPWRTTDQYGIIPYESVFYRTKKTSMVS